MKVIPYLNFNGNCKDALNYYTRIFSGEIIFVQTYGEAPKEAHMDVPDEYKDKIMHAQIKFGDNLLYFSDTAPGTKIKNANNVYISIDFDNENNIDRVYDNFFDSSKVDMSLQKTFWSPKFSSLTDKYGFRWILSL